jgi:hypothetical protein
MAVVALADAILLLAIVWSIANLPDVCLFALRGKCQ